MVDRVRKSYELGELVEATAGDDPFALMQQWLEDALNADIVEPNAMCLATVDAEGNPDARFVLLRGFDERGLVFYTNSQSAKGKQLINRPYATLVFWWGALERQVRIHGRVEQVDEAEADAYFATRPRGHQLAAWVSPQSELIPDRNWLERRASEVEQEFEGREVPRPPYWTGYRLVPDSFEFWQGRRNRLHDRLLFTRQPEGGWKRARLAP
ncbi:MAG: pyridoxamine 5'-phosphate oxidase [Fimbriimonadales bacterium]|nr:pyridoxamine 5'-phosphate oxidase [Fimbriimonadales bacterium]